MNAAPIQNPNTQADYYTDLPVGEILRRTRVHFGQSLDDAANYLRIRASQLDAIERNRIDQLPGQVYAIGYIRTYSEYLGLDGEKMVHLFKQQSGGKTVRPELHFPVPASESKAPNFYVIFGSLAVLVLVIGVWIVLGAVGRGKDKNNIDEIPVVPPELRAAVSQVPPAPSPVMNVPLDQAASEALPATATTATATTPAVSAVPDALAPELVDAETPPVTNDANTSENAGQVAATPAVDAPVSAVPVVAPGAKKEIVITVKDRSWVEVRDKKGKSLLSRILNPGEVFIVPESNYGLRLDTGNAGGIQLTVNGLPVQPLGKQGDILRGFLLDGNELLKKLVPPTDPAVQTTPDTKAR